MVLVPEIEKKISEARVTKVDRFMVHYLEIERDIPVPGVAKVDRFMVPEQGAEKEIFVVVST